MDTLPPEILAHIIQYFPKESVLIASKSKRVCRPRLARCASVSQAWKASVERLTFRDLTIATNELDAFSALFGGENITRWAYLSSLSVVFILPNPLNALGCCPVVRIPDRRADSVAFSTSVVELFTILRDLAARAKEKCPLSLSFYSAYRLSKFEEPKGTTNVPCSDQGRHSRREVHKSMAVSGSFELELTASVPTLPDIASFEFFGYQDLKDLRPTWIPEIIGRLPALERLRLATEDRYYSGRVRRLANRRCFSGLMRGLSRDNLREIRLDIRHAQMRNESSPVHSFVERSQWKKESWFRMFNHFATFPNLAILQLFGPLVVCPDFFRGITDFPETPPFPSLVELEIQFSAETADGRWFYMRDDEAIERSRSDPEYAEWWEEDAEEERNDGNRSVDSEDDVRVFEDEPFRTNVVFSDRYRSLPDSATFLPFLLGASNAVKRIPRLRKFVLKLGNQSTKLDDLTFYPIVTRIFELWYLKAGMLGTSKTWPPVAIPQITEDMANVNRNRLYWRLDRWKPWDEVQAEWTAIVGPDAKIVFLEGDK